MKRSEMLALMIEDLEAIDFMGSDLSDWFSNSAIERLTLCCLKTCEENGMLPINNHWEPEENEVNN